MPPFECTGASFDQDRSTRRAHTSYTSDNPCFYTRVLATTLKAAHHTGRRVFQSVTCGATQVQLGWKVQPIRAKRRCRSLPCWLDLLTPNVHTVPAAVCLQRFSKSSSVCNLRMADGDHARLARMCLVNLSHSGQLYRSARQACRRPQSVMDLLWYVLVLY